MSKVELEQNESKVQLEQSNSKVESQLEHLDSLTMELLHLISEYENIANGDFRESFINGFMNLSRANFNSTGLKTYGVDNIDLRTTEPCKKVKMNGDEFQLVDLLSIQKDRIKAHQREKEQKQQEKEKSEQKTKKEEEKPEKNDIPTAISSGVKNMSLKSETIDVDIETDSDPEPTLKDPIYQFGGLVPYQLRQCQSFFNTSLETCTKLATLEQKITSVVDKIEKLQ